MKSNQNKNEQYIKYLQHNNSKGIRLIYQKYFIRVYNMISKNGGLMVDAEDIFQEALMIIIEKSKVPHFKLTAHFYSYLYGICQRLWLSRLQLKSRKNTSLDSCYNLTDSFDIESVIHQNEVEQILWSQFSKLTDNAQKILLLVFEGKSMDEIRIIMGYASTNYTAKRKFYCQQMLIKLIKQDERYQELMELKNNNLLKKRANSG